MTMNNHFATLYGQLNPGQKLAVDSIEGPVMVVAGPGTGKTTILTLRIANILRETDTAPENILALTFTESATTNMRKKLAEIIGSQAYSVVINTFHGFCNDIIKNYPAEFPRIIGSQSITEIDQVKLLKEVINRPGLKELKPFGDTFYYLRPILNAINELKREGVSPEKFAKIVAQEQQGFEMIDDLYHEKGAHKGKMKGDYQTLQKQIKKNHELVRIYSEYQKSLTEQKLYDYSDMLLEVLNEIEQNKDLLLILQERSQYILVDEHQDTNNAQNKIIELLCNFHETPNLFAVGDEKQAIFRFQGASLENFNYFQKLYPKAKLITLEENYRSTQQIIDSAHSLLAGRTKLKSNFAHRESALSLFAFSRPEIENYFLGQDIVKKIKTGTAPQEIAVLYRDNRDAFSVAHTLEKLGVPFVIESDQNILDDVDIKKLIWLFDTVNNFGSDGKLLQAMHVDFLAIEPLDIYKIINHSNRERIPSFDIVRSDRLVSSLGLERPEKVRNFYRQLQSWKLFSDNNSLLELFEKVVRESGFLAYALSKPDAVEKLDKLNVFFDEIRSLIEVHKDYELPDFFDYLEILREQNVLIKRKIIGLTGNRVRLMTAHKSKGQEFEHVYIVNAYDGHWGNKRKPKLISLPTSIYALNDDLSPHSSKSNKKEPSKSKSENISQPLNISRDDECGDERRLFYVAITRAKKSVTITYAKTNAEGRECLPSQFVTEIEPKLLTLGDSESYEKSFAADKSILFAPSKKVHTAIKSKEFISEVFARRGLSVTALNNYLECPWKYFYQNLLRIPKPPEKHQMYGIAIHAALKDIFTDRQEKTKDYLIGQFEYYLKKQPMSDSDLLDWLERGKIALNGYYKQYHSRWDNNVLCEFNIGGILLTPSNSFDKTQDKSAKGKPEIRLTGQIDKIELLPNNQARPPTHRMSVGVNVVDYKTGKPKSRNMIDGKTKSSDGNIRRQLVFYNLLLNHYGNDGPPSRDATARQSKYKMVSGDIDFVEPDEKGRYHKERFEIAATEIKELEKLIYKTTDEILNLKFWDKKCDSRDCEFCALQEAMV